MEMPLLKKLQLENQRLREDISNLIPSVIGKGESVTLNGTANARFKKLNISGNSKQEVSVQGKNLLDMKWFTKNGGHSWTDGHMDKTCVILNKLIEVKPSTSYTFSVNDFDLRYGIQQYNSEDVNIRLADSGWQTANSYTFTTLENTNRIWIIVSSPDYSYDITPEQVQQYKMQLEEGEAATEYEPFVPNSPSRDYPSKIKSCGEILIPNNGKDYTQLDFIESTGTQYINLNYLPTKDTNIELDTEYLGPFNNGPKSLIGSRTNPSYPDRFGIWVDSGNKEMCWTYSIYETGYIEGTDATQRHVLANNKDAFLIDGKEVAKATVQVGEEGEWNPRFALLLFGLNNWGQLQTREICMRVYRLKIYEQDVLVRDFIPCVRNSDNEVGIYDLIENKFYGNDGTGTFVKSNNTGLNIKICNEDIGNKDAEYKEQNYSILPQQPFRAVGDVRDTFIKKNGKWHERHFIKRIESYSSEAINTEYISTTGELSEGATVDYVADEPIDIECDAGQIAVLNEIENAKSYKGTTYINSTDEINPYFEVEAFANIQNQ